MIPDIAKRFDALEVRRIALVERVRALSPEQQRQRPSPKGFSPLDLVMHFALAESGNNGFLRKAPPAKLKGSRVKHGFAYRTALKSMQDARPIGAPPMYVPKGTYTLDEADKAWESARNELATYLEQVERPEDATIKLLFFFGTLSASDYLEFTEAHMHYHEARFPVDISK